MRAVITAADVPDVRYGGGVKDEKVFARERVRFAGQPLAAVAAGRRRPPTRRWPRSRSVCEPLPAVVDVAAALAPGAPLVHEGWAGYTALPILHREGNVCNRARIVVGDVERGFEEADRIFEHRFTTRQRAQGYTEPRAAVAQWDSAGQVTVWSNTQLPFEVQSTLAEISQLPPCEVRVIVPGIGGGFGGKLRVGVEHFAALLARKTGRAVKVMTTSEEELTAAYARQPAIVELKTGVSRDGRILAREGRAHLVRHRRLRRLGAGGGVGRDAGAGRAVPDPEPPPRGLRRLHEQDELRVVPRAVGAAGELRGRVADGHHRRRSRDRSARLPAPQHRPRGRRGADRAGADRGRARGVPAQGGGRHRLDGPTARARAWQGHRLRLVDHDGRLLRRLREDQPGRHGGAQHRRRRDRHRRPHRRGPGPRRGARDRSGRHQRRVGGHASRRHTTSARRAAARRSRSATRAGPRRRT